MYVPSLSLHAPRACARLLPLTPTRRIALLCGTLSITRAMEEQGGQLAMANGCQLGDQSGTHRFCIQWRRLAGSLQTDPQECSISYTGSLTHTFTLQQVWGEKRRLMASRRAASGQQGPRAAAAAAPASCTHLAHAAVVCCAYCCSHTGRYVNQASAARRWAAPCPPRTPPGSRCRAG